MNYYVSTNGSDLWSGTKDHPFLTVRRAMNKMKAGDTLLLFNGAYPKNKTFVMRVMEVLRWTFK
jgi:hypothetical protein